MRHEEGLRREPQSSAVPTPLFTRNHDTWSPMYRTGGNYSQNCMMDAPRHAVSELRFGKFTEFPDPDDFQCWRVNFTTKVCVNTSSLQLIMSWINEVEMAKSLDDLVTSQSVDVLLTTRHFA